MVQVLTLAALLLAGHARTEFGADVKGLVGRIKSRQYFGAEESLKGTFKEARPHLPRLAVELTDMRKREFYHAIFLAGPPTEDQREAFEKLLEHPNPAVRVNASGALSANDRKWNKTPEGSAIWPRAPCASPSTRRMKRPSTSSPTTCPRSSPKIESAISATSNPCGGMSTLICARAGRRALSSGPGLGT